MSTRKHVVVVLVALMMLTSGVALVGAASASAGASLSVQDDEANDTSNDTSNDTDEADDETAQPSASVTFSDQTTDGTSVVVDEVTMEEGGFVTIHDSSLLVGNALESVLGTSEYLEAGTHEDVEIHLDTTLEESETLIAMPHLDTNDNETYDFVETEGEDDGPYLTEDGEPVTDEAAVTLESAEEPADDADDADDSETDTETDDDAAEKPSDCPVEEDDGDDAEAEPPADDADEEPADDADEEPADDADEEPADDADDAPVMEPDADAVEDGVTIINANFSSVTIEQVTIENVYILVLDDEEALDRLAEMLGDEENVTVVDGEDEMDGVDDNETDDYDDNETDVGDDHETDDNETDAGDGVDDDESDIGDDNETDVGDDDDMDDNETDTGVDDNESDIGDDETDDADDNETDVGDDDETDVDDDDDADDNETDAGVGDGDDMDDNETDTGVDDNDTDVGDDDMESFTVENLDAPENATVGDTITVNATVTNPNDEEATQDVEFRVDGDLIESQSVTLDGDESDTVEFEVETGELEAGEYVHMILTDEFGEVAFLELTEEDEMDDTETDADDADDNETDADDNDTDETDDYDDNETDDNETDDTDTDSRIPIGVIGLV
ncbi:DUF7282 domain-containing protein [Natronosalvus halobius]|uniref:DUF7282 domain-containing protein n=1 Tax=Natronosalvus halobius TaxID=2953746 RepID=UPI0020A1C5B2|nr:hypothetical protein [Natronosalvus halobius]USZ71626.1 hypothetical protein NGM15_16435 [Natronosalvus halobius]